MGVRAKTHTSSFVGASEVIIKQLANASNLLTETCIYFCCQCLLYTIFSALYVHKVNVSCKPFKHFKSFPHLFTLLSLLTFYFLSIVFIGLFMHLHVYQLTRYHKQNADMGRKSYLFVLICGDGDKLGFWECKGLHGVVRQTQRIRRFDDVKSRLVLVHRVEYCLSIERTQTYQLIKQSVRFI